MDKSKRVAKLGTNRVALVTPVRGWLRGVFLHFIQQRRELRHSKKNIKHYQHNFYYQAYFVVRYKWSLGFDNRAKGRDSFSGMGDNEGDAECCTQQSLT